MMILSLPRGKRLIGMAANGWEWFGMDGNAPNGREYLRMDENGRECLEMNGNVRIVFSS